MSSINLAITDDDTLIVTLLKEFLDSRPEFNVLFTADGGTGLFAELAVAAVLPDVLLLDLKMKDTDGISITKELKIKYPSINIIVISSHYQLSFMGFMLKAGVSAFLPKGISPRELPAIIQTVAEEGVYFRPDQLSTVREQISAKAPQPVIESENSLSEREIDVLRLLCQQKTAKEIGDLLFITQRTVEGHKNNLFTKTGVKNVAGLVIYAIQRGIINVEDLPVI